MFLNINSLQEFENLKSSENAFLAYFSTENCNVCKILKPKIQDLIENQFEKIKLTYIQSDVLPDVAANNSVFSAPVIIIFFNGREYIRKNRNFGIKELEQEIRRPYSLIFSE